MKHNTETSFIIAVVLVILLVGITWIYRMIKVEREEKSHTIIIFSNEK